MQVVEFTELMELMKYIAEAQTPVQTATDGDVYENWNGAEIKYGAFNVGFQEAFFQGQICTYRFVLYYGDRLMQDRSNANDIYADGIRVITAIVNNLNNVNGVQVTSDPVDMHGFEQKFMDYLSGVYAIVDIACESVLGECDNLLSPEWRLGMNLPAGISVDLPTGGSEDDEETNP